MKPERAQELYSEYVEGTLSPALRLALEQHFEAHPQERADYEQFAQLYVLLNTSERVEVDVPSGFRARVLEQVSREQARQKAAPRGLLADLFGGLGRRRAPAGLLAAFAVIALAAVFIPIAASHYSQSGIIQIMPPPPLVPTTITGVTPQVEDGATYYHFHIHLPPSVPHATLTAYVVTESDQITDPGTRAREATPALAQPQPLANNEAMEIPLAFQQAPTPGTTLNLLVQWQPDNASLPAGAQVVFEPIGGAVASAPAPATGSVYDALQAIAVQYGVTVIADATVVPNQAVAAPASAPDALTALQAVAKQVHYAVHKLPSGAYQVSPAP